MKKLFYLHEPKWSKSASGPDRTAEKQRSVPRTTGPQTTTIAAVCQ